MAGARAAVSAVDDVLPTVPEEFEDQPEPTAGAGTVEETVRRPDRRHAVNVVMNALNSQALNPPSDYQEFSSLGLGRRPWQPGMQSSLLQCGRW